MDDHYILRLVNIEKKYGKVPALEGINLKVRRGDFFVILGPSGSGKSTLLKIIGGLEVPDKGEVYINDKLMNNVPPFRRPTSLVFQDLALFPHLNVYENIAYGLKVRKLDKSEIHRRVRWAAELLHIENLLERRVTQLSGGQQQRVALARSLVIEPEILLLDEPLGPLDLKIRRELQVELKRIQRQLGATWIYVTHDHEEAMTMSDQVAIVNNGRLVALDSIRNLYEHPPTKFVAEFLGHSNILSAELFSIKNNIILIKSGGLFLELPKRVYSFNSNKVFVLIRPEKISISPSGSSNNINHVNNTVGEVISISYKGVITELKVRTAEEIILTVFKTDCENINVKDTVTLSWRPEDVVIIERDAE